MRDHFLLLPHWRKQNHVIQNIFFFDLEIEKLFFINNHFSILISLGLLSLRLECSPSRLNPWSRRFSRHLICQMSNSGKKILVYLCEKKIMWPLNQACQTQVIVRAVKWNKNAHIVTSGWIMSITEIFKYSFLGIFIAKWNFTSPLAEMWRFMDEN